MGKVYQWLGGGGGGGLAPMMILLGARGG